MKSDDELLKLELLIAKLLRYGVLVAGALLLVGWCANLNFTSNPLAEFSTYHRESLSVSVKSAWSHGDWAIIIAYSGLVTLISLPFLRVIMTAVLFYKQHEYVLAGVATFVCLALIGSALLGFDI